MRGFTVSCRRFHPLYHRQEAAMKPLPIVLAPLGATVLLGSITPARADDDRWRRHESREQSWRQHEWRGHERREQYYQPGYGYQRGYGYQQGYGYGYAPPPPVYYAPPPPVYYA